MKYVSIDIETSGLDTENHQVLSIGAVIEDTKKKLPLRDIPKFYCIVLQRQITGSPRALDMNKGIIQFMGAYLDSDQAGRNLLSESMGFYEKDEVAKAFYRFLHPHFYNPGERTVDDIGKVKNPLLINVAGKNFGTFDNVFLKKLPWWQKLIVAKQRIIDPAPLFVDWENDEELPSLTECKSRAGIGGSVTHNALEDAWDVVEVLRKKY